jgi:hypothetical protein
MSCRLVRFACCALFVSAAGCAEDSSGVAATGVLIAQWGGSLCAEDGVARLRLTLPVGDSDGGVTEVQCAAREHRFSAVPVGDHDLVVQYLGPGDVGALPVDDGSGAAVNELTFPVHVDGTTERTVLIGANVLMPIVDGGIEDGPANTRDGPVPPTDDDADGVFDEYDNCLGTFNPDQLDTDQDKTGNACDCAPADGDLEVSVLDDDLDADVGQLVAVDGIWSFFGGVYRQSDPNGLSRSWRPADVLGAAAVDTAIEITASGAGAVGGVPFAGVALRASSFAVGPVDGLAYVCGTDGDALILAIFDAGAGTVTPLSSQVLPFAVSGVAPLHASAKGDALVCRLTNPANAAEWLELTAVDTTLATGAAAFVTNAMAADYGFARVCAED